MSEIKSTIDLVMERTRHMTMSEEERAEARASERAAKARGFVLGLREGRLEPGELPRLMEESSAGDRNELRAALLETLINALDLEEGNSALPAGVESLAGEAAAESISAFKRIVQEHADLKKEMTATSGGAVLRDLERIGVTGSALRAKADADQEYAQNLERLTAQNEARLDRVRTSLLSRLGL